MCIFVSINVFVFVCISMCVYAHTGEIECELFLWSLTKSGNLNLKILYKKIIYF